MNLLLETPPSFQVRKKQVMETSHVILLAFLAGFLFVGPSSGEWDVFDALINFIDVFGRI